MVRVFKLTSPYVHGEDVKNFQILLNKRSQERHLSNIKVDGEYGPSTQQLYRRVAYYLGLSQKAIDKGATNYTRKLIKNPKLRNPVQLVRAKKRINTFRKSDDKRKLVIEWLYSHVGETETPGKPNRGPLVDRLQLEFGKWMLGQPWCGALVGFVLRRIAKIPVPAGIVYTPNILTWAQNGQFGFKRGLISYKNAKPGDVALLKFPGVSKEKVDHTGIVVAVEDGKVVTVEGNTSSGRSGSQNNGGGVYRRTRPVSQFVGFARPNY